MADVVMTFTIPSVKVPRIVESFNATFEKEPGETDKQMFQRVIKNYVVDIDTRYFQRKAKGLIVRDEDVIGVT